MKCSEGWRKRKCQCLRSLRPTFSPKPVTGGKKYVKVKTSKLSAESCILPDRRLTSIRQQSEKLLSVAGSAIAASPSTIFRERETIRMNAMKNSEALLKGCDFFATTLRWASSK